MESVKGAVTIDLINIEGLRLSGTRHPLNDLMLQ